MRPEDRTPKPTPESEREKGLGLASEPEPASVPEPMPEGEVNAEGVDMTLIHWMLSLTPAERVEHIEGIARSIEALKELNRGR